MLKPIFSLSGPNRRVKFLSEDGETISHVQNNSRVFELSGSANTSGEGTSTDTNTWRPIQVGGTDKLTDSTTAINFAGSGATSVSYADGTITIESPELSAATTEVLGGVKIDGDTIKVNNDGQLYADVGEGGGGGSSLTGGSNNTTSGLDSVAFGSYNTTSGNNSVVTGNHASNTVDGVVCNNNLIPNGAPMVLNTYGNCGFKGITCNGQYNIPIWNFSVNDIFIAKINIIGVNTSDCQVQNIIVKNCTFLRNDVEFPTELYPGMPEFNIGNGVLYMSTPDGGEYQIGIFYTLSKGAGDSNSSSSSSSSS